MQDPIYYNETRTFRTRTAESMIRSHRASAVILRRPLSYYRRPPQPTSHEVAQLLSKYATSPPRPINLSELLSFGRPLTDESALDSVSYALAEIPRRLATRVRSLEALPFIVGTNPYIAKTLNAFRDSFQTLATYPPVTTAQENVKFTELLANLVQSHANDIPTMAKG
jgi:26S proteasome regulatory subunit T1